MIPLSQCSQGPFGQGASPNPLCSFLSDELCRSCACLFNDTSIYIISFDDCNPHISTPARKLLCCVGSYRIYFYRSISFQFIERVTGVVTDTSPVVFVHFCGGCFCQLVSCLEVIPADMILSQYPFDRCKSPSEELMSIAITRLATLASVAGPGL